MVTSHITQVDSQGKMVNLDTLLDQIMLAGEGAVQVTSHTIKKDAGTWAINHVTPTVFLPKIKA